MYMDDKIFKASDAPDADNRNATGEENLPAGAVKCISCGTLGYQTDRYCPCCGAEMPRSCAECGAAITHPIAFYCTACGSMLEAPRGVGEPPGS
jgi:hypothetical protein